MGTDVGADRGSPPTASRARRRSPATASRSTARIGPSGSSSTSRPSPCGASRSGCTRPTRRRRSSTCSATAAPRSTSPRTRSRPTRCSRSTASGSPTCRRIIFVEPRGLVGNDDDRLLFWDNFLELGREHNARSTPARSPTRMASAELDDVMTLVYTSGTTGPPKGAMLTNKNAAFSHRPHRQQPGSGARADRRTRATSSSPISRCATSPSGSSRRGRSSAPDAVLNFAESIDVVNENLREVQPTIFFAVPRIWEKLHAVALIKASDATWFKKQDPQLRPQARHARSAGSRSPTVVTTRSSSRILYAFGWVHRLPGDARAARPATLPVRELRCGRHRPRGARVLHRHRRPGVRALRDDRELGGRDRRTSSAA